MISLIISNKKTSTNIFFPIFCSKQLKEKSKYYFLFNFLSTIIFLYLLFSFILTERNLYSLANCLHTEKLNTIPDSSCQIRVKVLLLAFKLNEVGLFFFFFHHFFQPKSNIAFKMFLLQLTQFVTEGMKYLLVKTFLL